MSPVLLLTEGDRTCEECQGKGVVRDEEEQYGEFVEVEVACEHCENGRVTERQNPTKPIDLSWVNQIGRELILLDQFKAAIKRRGCDGRGVKRQRFLLGAERFGMVEMRINMPSGPAIPLPPARFAVLPRRGVTVTSERVYDIMEAENI